jgi:6-phosphofructokinase 2
MKRIVTVTFNPAVDKSTMVEELISEHKMHTNEPYYHAGGGGVNVVRALHNLGFPATAIYFKGGRMGAFFVDLLDAEKVTSIPIDIKGATRENFIVNERSTGRQFRFGLPGPEISSDELNDLFFQLKAIDHFDFLVVSGSLQSSVPMDIFDKLKAIAVSKDAKIVVDTSGKALESSLSTGVFLIKPSLRELAGLVGEREINVKQAIEVARDLIRDRKCEVIVISMGGRGATLVTDKRTLMVHAPKVSVVSTVGAGDSMLAGILASLANDDDYATALHYGVACGSAATLTPGTKLCAKKDADELFEQVKESGEAIIDIFNDEPL